MKKLCYVCGKRPPKRLASIYKYATDIATFCSRKCAAEYGLLVAGNGGEDQLRYCKQHGWYVTADDDCPDCRDQHLCRHGIDN